MVTVLELEGYQPEAVASTREAIARLAAEPDPYSIVISDIYLTSAPASTCCTPRVSTIRCAP